MQKWANGSSFTASKIQVAAIFVYSWVWQLFVYIFGNPTMHCTLPVKEPSKPYLSPDPVSGSTMSISRQSASWKHRDSQSLAKSSMLKSFQLGHHFKISTHYKPLCCEQQFSFKKYNTCRSAWVTSMFTSDTMKYNMKQGKSLEYCLKLLFCTHGYMVTTGVWIHCERILYE